MKKFFELFARTPKVEHPTKNGEIPEEGVILSARIGTHGMYGNVQGVVERIVPFYTNGVLTKAFYEVVILEQDQSIIDKYLAKAKLNKNDPRFKKNATSKPSKKEITLAEFNKTKSAYGDGKNQGLVFNIFKKSHSKPEYFNLVARMSNGFENITDFEIDSDGIIKPKPSSIPNSKNIDSFVKRLNQKVAS